MASSTTGAGGAGGTDAVDLDTLAGIERRLLWLSTRMIDAANAGRDAGDGMKVGGHQASSASLVTVMTALWFAFLGPHDRVSVKPHASPVYHAIMYLLGRLDRSYLPRLRAKGGLQSYPSRTKDPDGVDFSTGSVGLGAAAPLFAAVVRRYVDAHFGPRPRSRFIALIGDAELDEGNIWEAVADPATAGLDNVIWVVDFNRQSLDRVVPGIRINQWRSQFEANGWHVEEAKYGTALSACFERPDGEHLREWIDAMPNEQYQALFGLEGPELVEAFLDGAPAEVVGLLDGYEASEVKRLVTDLGGHDIASVLRGLRACDAAGRPAVLFAYTIKGWGLPLAGNPRNHAALLSPAQVDALRAEMSLTPQTEWDGFADGSPEAVLVRQRAELLAREPAAPSARPVVPVTTGFAPTAPTSTQEAFGRILVNLSRDQSVASCLVTTAPDVATSTNLAGFINRMGVFSPTRVRSWHEDPVLRWAEDPTGHHIELGISEMNLFLLLGQLGLAAELSDQVLLPIGTVYDPFVCRGLDALIYGTYSGARFIVAGTPSGITLAPEGGAHQSTITASIGTELPGLAFTEPAYARALDWLVCDALSGIAGAQGQHARPGRESAYFRLSTRPIDQAPFDRACERMGEAVLRRAVIAGAYRLVDAAAPTAEGRRGIGRSRSGTPEVTLAGSGAVLPEVLAAAAELTEEGIATHVVDVTSMDRLYRGWQGALRQAVRTATPPAMPGSLRAAFPADVPIVTIHDAASHAMAWIGSAVGVPSVALGVDEFGESGTLPELYAAHDLDAGSIVNAALSALAL
ncbi:MAG: hypothetical protein KGP12_06215 [Actinomycetales bacterium]|nr:hypothetical protein [Actinomycetales bacterium]